MENGDGVHADKRSVTRPSDGAIDEVVRVGPIEDDERAAARGASLHQIVHRADVRVEPCADVLDVEDHHVDVAHLGHGRAERAAEERHDGDVALGVATVGHPCASILGTTKAVLRREDLAHIDPQREERVEEVCLPWAHDGGLIDGQCHASALQEGEEGVESLVAQRGRTIPIIYGQRVVRVGLGRGCEVSEEAREADEQREEGFDHKG